MELQDELREVKIHAISLSRPKGRRRAAATRGGGAESATARVWAIAAPALAAPHQGARALLGLSSLAVKASRSTWDTLVAEGTRVEAALRRRIASVVGSLSLPTLGSVPAAGRHQPPDAAQQYPE
jgi:hypothetical protein